MTGTLFLVATPIGNLGDLSPRALETLRSVDLVAAEDTRTSGRLLAHFGVKKPLLSCHEHNEVARAAEIVARLLAGESVALVTDAGSPGISDPGYPVVRSAAAAGVQVVAVPGPSAALLALQVSGLPTDTFTFVGFYPKKAAALRRFLSRALLAPGTVVGYVPARDTAAALDALCALTPAPPPVAACRELTKLHEEVLRGPADQVAAAIRARESGADERVWKGEVTLVFAAAATPDGAPDWTDEALTALLADALAEHGDRKQALRAIREETGQPRARLYALLESLKRD